MNELDKLFKDKLQNRTFEFKDAYWEDAERLIELDQDDKRRRGGLWWKFGALLLVLGIAGFFFMDRQNAADIYIDASSSQEVIDPNYTDQTKASHLLNNKNNLDQSEHTVNTKTQDTAIQSESNGHEDNDPNTGSLSRKTEVSSYELSTPNSKTIRKGTIGSDSQDNSKEIKALDVENIDIQLPAPDSTTKGREIAVEKNLNLPSSIDFATSKNDESKEENIENETLTLLETRVAEIEFPKEECDGCFDFGKVKQNPFSMGVVAEGITYPVKKEETNWRGGSVGLAAKYKLNRKWALNSGVQYSMIQGNEGRVLDQIQNGSFAANLQRSEYDYYEENQYTFGLRNVSAIFPPKTFHSIDVPLTVQFSHKHSSFELGFQWNVLLGIRGSQVTSYSLFPWEQEPLGASSSFEVNEVKSKEWLPKDNYRKVLTRLTVGYSYAFNPRFSVGVNAYYRTHKLNNNFSDTETNISFDSNELDSFTPKRFHVRLGATYFY